MTVMLPARIEANARGISTLATEILARLALPTVMGSSTAVVMVLEMKALMAVADTSKIRVMPEGRSVPKAAIRSPSRSTTPVSRIPAVSTNRPMRTKSVSLPKPARAC